MAYSDSEGGPLEIYHEKQVASLCGVHCLNTLLQANAFNAIDLSQIAQELDRREREVLAEGGMSSKDYLAFVAGDSQNVSDEGNFSIQVLSEALKVYNISCVPINNSKIVGIKNEPQLQEAFICNLREHWFTVRKLDGVWYNLNSCNGMPERISEFYLSAFLAQLEAEQYTIFVALGKLPVGDKTMGVSDSGKWWSLEAMEKEKQNRSQAASFSDALKNTFDSMQGLLQNAGSQMQQALGISQAHEDEDADLKAAIEASLASQNQNQSQGNQEQPESQGQQEQGSASQRELAQALAASLEEYNKSAQEEQKPE